MGVKFKFDGVTLLTLLVLAGAFLVWRNRDSLNPFSEDNAANQALVGVVGQDTVDSAFDDLVYGITLMNPFSNESLRRQAMVYFGFAGEGEALLGPGSTGE